MAISLRCQATTWYDAAAGQYQRCGHTWDVAETAAGTVIACPACGADLTVPRSTPTARQLEQRRRQADGDDVLPFPDDLPSTAAANSANPANAAPRPVSAPPQARRPTVPTSSNPAGSSSQASSSKPRPGGSRPSERTSSPTSPPPAAAPPNTSRPASSRPTPPGPNAQRPTTPPATPSSNPARSAPLKAIPVDTNSASGPSADFYGTTIDPTDEFTLAPPTALPPTSDPLFAALPPMASPGTPVSSAGPPGGDAFGRTLQPSEQVFQQAETRARRDANSLTCPKCGGAVTEQLCFACGWHQGLQRKLSEFTPDDNDSRGFMRYMESHLNGVPPRAALAWATALGLLFVFGISFAFWVLTPLMCVLTLPLMALIYAVLVVSGFRRADGSKAIDTWTITLAIQRNLGWRSGTKLQPVRAVTHRNRSFTDADLSDLEEWYEAEALDLEGTAVTDRGLAALLEMPKLMYLVVRNTQVSEQAVIGFQKRRPRVWIWR